MRPDAEKDNPDGLQARPHQDGPSTVATDEGGWWEHERAIFIREQIEGLLSRDGAILDVGCGRGTMLGGVRFRENGLVVGVDSYVWPEWTDRNVHSLYVCAMADQLPFRDGVFDVVGSFDVLEHIPGDLGAMTEQARVAKPAGIVVTSVPAHPKLWSAHDDSVGHLRRHTTASITALASAAGLERTRSTYFFSWLAIPAYLMRHHRARGQEPGNGTGPVHRLAHIAIRLAGATERKVLRWFRLPAGTSLWAEFKQGNR